MSTAGLELLDTRALKCLVRRSTSDSPRPLLCFLHGSDEAAPLDIFAALTRHGPLRPGNRAQWIDRFVIVAPQLPSAGDHWQRHGNVVRDLVLDVCKQVGCDMQRLYLTGFSFGGNGVFDLALAQRGLWAALWAVDPTRVPAKPIDTPIWLSIGEVSRYQTRAFLQRLALQPADGEEASDRVWLDDQEDHVGTAARAYRDERIYQWLLSKRRR